MTTSPPGRQLPLPTPHQRLLALRALPPRIQLFATLTTCVVGPLDAMAVDRCLQRVMADQDLLMHGDVGQVQEVLDQDLEAWGEWVIGELYDVERFDYGRSLLARYMNAWNGGRDEYSIPASTRALLVELAALAADDRARAGGAGN